VSSLTGEFFGIASSAQKLAPPPASARTRTVAYVPLNMVNDQVGDQRQAFSARMLYSTSTGEWGIAPLQRQIGDGVQRVARAA
jgi:hypothetical protein